EVVARKPRFISRLDESEPVLEQLTGRCPGNVLDVVEDAKARSGHGKSFRWRFGSDPDISSRQPPWGGRTRQTRYPGRVARASFLSSCAIWAWLAFTKSKHDGCIAKGG